METSGCAGCAAAEETFNFLASLINGNVFMGTANRLPMLLLTS